MAAWLAEAIGIAMPQIVVETAAAGCAESGGWYRKLSYEAAGEEAQTKSAMKLSVWLMKAGENKCENRL